MVMDATQTSYLVSILRGMHARRELILSPKFQRRPVWPTAARSYFIDTLLRGFPVPPIHLRITRESGQRDSILEVIDGQQRLNTVFDFIDGGIRLSRSIEATWAGKKFEQLLPEQQEFLLDRKLAVFQYSSVTDSEVLQIFERFNVNSIQLNAQELRNGRFFGPFKQSAYALSREYLEFWRDNKIFSDSAVARMVEVEFTSELLILLIRGLQDKKNTINTVYAEYDDEWPERLVVEAQFRAVMDNLISALGDILGSTAFRKRPLFYTLFGAVAHWLIGLPNLTLPRLVAGGEHISAASEPAIEPVAPLAEPLTVTTEAYGDATPPTPTVTIDASLTEDEERALRDSVEYWTEVLSRPAPSDDLADIEYDQVGPWDEDTLDFEPAQAIDPEEQYFFTSSEQTFRTASSSQTDNLGPRQDRLTLFYVRAFAEFIRRE